MRVFSFVAAAIIGITAAASVQSAEVRPGRILFTRDSLAPTQDQAEYPAASALYVIDANGQNQRQLTPLQDGHFRLPGVESNSFVWYRFWQDWLSKNFSAQGKQILYFSGQTATFPNYLASLSGKYKIRDGAGNIRNLFPGQDDVSAGRGFVTWGPPGSREIAYTNSVEAQPSSPACVFLIHPDGTGAHSLWCPSGYGSSVAVTDLRWSGNGRYLLAYVNSNHWCESCYSYRDLWRIEVSTGEAVRVAINVATDGTDDISYDGNKIVFVANGIDDPSEGGCEKSVGRPPVATLCLADLSNGRQLTVLAQDPTSVLLLSPSGARTLTYYFGTPLGDDWPGYSEIDIFLIRTCDGSLVRQLTKPPAAGWPQKSYVTWRAVAWSSDGKRLLANRDVRTPISSFPVTEFFIIDVADGTQHRVGKGNAVDWYQPAW